MVFLELEVQKLSLPLPLSTTNTFCLDVDSKLHLFALKHVRCLQKDNT